MTDGEVRLWGSAFDYVNTPQGPSDSTVLIEPTPVAGIHGAYAVTVGSDHACALLSDSRVACWGQNSNGQLGNGTTIDSIATPVQVVGLE
jgi:alpha-tubulin suppressor-like RCC1 family protein